MGAQWVQVATTVGTFAACTAASAGVYFPLSTRIRDRHEKAIKASISEIVTTVIADVATKEQLTEVKREIEAVRATSNDTQLKLATQFGGNGGGIRQAIDTHGRAIARIEGKLGIEASE